MSEPQVSILIPNYKTPKLTKLCLRLIRKYTSLELAKVIVIDNDSRDQSSEYLRQLDWIELIERNTQTDRSGPESHARALDDAMATVTTPYVLSIHTDTMVKNKHWLPFLLSHINSKGTVAGVGSWKLEAKPFVRRVAKSIERKVQTRYYHLTGKDDHAITGVGKNTYYLRSHCALYRADLIKQLGLTFMDEHTTAGKALHDGLTKRGYEMIFLPSETLGQYVDHLNHATMVLNPELGARDRTVRNGLRRIKRGLKQLEADKILTDCSLDS